MASTVAEVHLQHVAVEEEHGGQRLVLGAGGDVAIDREVSEESLDFGEAHVTGVPPPVGGAMEADELLDPGEVALLGAAGEVPQADQVPDLFEELHEIVQAGCAGRTNERGGGKASRA
jgi:hypothetical protein